MIDWLKNGSVSFDEYCIRYNQGWSEGINFKIITFLKVFVKTLQEPSMNA